MRSSFLPVLVLITACAGGTGSSAETDLEAVFCEILANGPEQDVTAGTSADDAPEVAIDGVNVEIALLDDGDGYSGVVRYTPDEDGSFAIGFKDDVPFTVLDPDGVEVPVDAEVRGASCPDLAVRYTLTLTAQTHIIEFGPTEHPEADIVSEESDDDL